MKSNDRAIRQAITLCGVAIALWGLQLAVLPRAIALDLTSSGTAPLTVSPTNLVFGSQVVGTTSAAQPVTLTNSGTVAISVASIGVTGGQADDFPQSNNCGTSLAAGAACKIAIFFAPVSAGTKAAALTIEDSAGGSPQRVSL